MLKLAIDAQLPVIAVSTRDTMNLAIVLKHITKKPVIPWVANMPVTPGNLYMHVYTRAVELKLFQIYDKMVKAECTFLIVNPPKIDEPMFDAGEVPVPRELLMKFMSVITSDEKKSELLLRGLGGCTLKEAAELSRLTMARDSSLTVDGLTATRTQFFQGSRGLTQVDTKQGFYDPPEELAAWIKKEKTWFLTGADPRLIPRGLLLDGNPGTGKTAGAKFIAQQFGVPLYRMDVGGIKGKWVGESEGNLLINLSRIDQEAPCCVLFDEVEKVFASANTDSSGTTSTMLSQLLWWLAERRTRVLVIMTTNNAKALPKELYREGRVDKVLVFQGLATPEANAFVVSVLATFGLTHQNFDSTVNLIINKCFKSNTVTGEKPMATQASLTEAVYAYVKLQGHKLVQAA